MSPPNPNRRPSEHRLNAATSDDDPSVVLETYTDDAGDTVAVLSDEDNPSAWLESTVVQSVGR